MPLMHVDLVQWRVLCSLMLSSSWKRTILLDTTSLEGSEPEYWDEGIQIATAVML
jgi:hypothetical protein